MNKKLIYYFNIKAESPVYFGTSDKESTSLKRSDDPRALVVSGNSIGGALREYLIRTGETQECLLRYMGGIKTSIQDADNTVTVKEEFKESSIYISDGEFVHPPKFLTKEGTAIDPTTGAAQHNQKYTFDYLPRGTEITFHIECDVEGDESEEQVPTERGLKQLIEKWTRGIIQGELRFGGEKSNGFGKFSLVSMERIAFDFDSLDAVDEYIFCRKNRKREKVDLGFLDEDKVIENLGVVFSLKGSFPYGVYQSFKDNSLMNDKVRVTGLQKCGEVYFIPATSLKGLLRSEIMLLFRKMTDCETKAKEKCSELFGDTDRQGKLVFSDISIQNAQTTKKVQGSNAKDESTYVPVYIKIDRLTGGAFSSALKHQNEVQGDAEIRFRLLGNGESFEESPYLFPLIYVLRRIGAGKVPLGGRTVIGLGQFEAVETVVTGSGWKSEFTNQGVLSEESTQSLKRYFETFERWVLT
ncbi:RAMP superfamily CRISPR-associated protein [Sporosarcina limicola]|uniref:CRISPR/Cas system CSM-associated protein Csm3 (Group 7 of RAMP superfamily) n=1 Tax=Sporosarcina limicola TaxID=34101 RepID=A0A927MQA4_9BACL|nr:RAMP superfamily CRISPR-associated protein [Sporosarcina limicola]MBE1555401.1 CRISPR/Cas system CSM-associated protein Csm3 (group 7 of RAMP superfamily) [Sporosarcina limicola]